MCGARRRLERCPQKATQFASDRHNDLRQRLVLVRQLAEAAAQALLRSICDRNHSTGLSFATSRQRDADARTMLVMPRRFNEQPTDQRVTGSRDPAAPMLLTRRVLTGYEAEIRHQGTWRLKSPKVMELRQDQDRGQRIDPAEASQPADRFAIRVRLSDLGQPRIELDEASFGMINRQQIVIDDDALGRLGPFQPVDPVPVRACPVPSAEVQAAAKEQFAQPMPTPLEIFACVI